VRNITSAHFLAMFQAAVALGGGDTSERRIL
jgi:hypothetical protein